MCIRRIKYLEKAIADLQAFRVLAQRSIQTNHLVPWNWKCWSCSWNLIQTGVFGSTGFSRIPSVDRQTRWLPRTCTRDVTALIADRCSSFNNKYDSESCSRAYKITFKKGTEETLNSAISLPINDDWWGWVVRKIYRRIQFHGKAWKFGACAKQRLPGPSFPPTLN